MFDLGQRKSMWNGRRRRPFIVIKSTANRCHNDRSNNDSHELQFWATINSTTIDVVGFVWIRFDNDQRQVASEWTPKGKSSTATTIISNLLNNICIQLEFAIAKSSIVTIGSDKYDDDTSQLSSINYSISSTSLFVLRFFFVFYPSFIEYQVIWLVMFLSVGRPYQYT